MPPKQAPGLEEENQLREAGFTDEEVNSWRQDTAASLSNGGFNSTEIGEYFGGTNPDLTATKEYFRQNLAAPVAGDGQAPAEPAEPEGFIDTLGKAWGFAKEGAKGTALGMLIEGRQSDFVLPEDAGMFYRIASQAGALAGDLPLMAVGGAAGAIVAPAAGAALGTALLPGPGTVAGATAGLVAGAPAGAFAMPHAMRKLVMDHYEKGDVKDFNDFWERASGAFIEAYKGGITGAVTGLAGVTARAALATAPAAARVTAIGASEVVAMTSVGAALNAQVPKPEEFLDAAVLIGGLHGMNAVAGRLRSRWAATGQRPDAVALEAQNNAALKQDLIGRAAPPEAARPDTSIEIYEQRKAQLEAAGVTPEEADAGAKLHQSFMRATAEATGLDPLDVAERFPLEITRVEGEPGAARPGELAQEPALAPTFYSKLERTIESKMGTTASVQQVEGLLKDIKAEERKWSGIDELLRGKEKVSRDEVLAHIRGNRVEIREVVKGGDAALNQGFELFQKGAKEPLGRFGTTQDSAVINLFRNADKSTFLHESWHYFFDVYGKLAEAADAPAELKSRYADFLTELGAESRQSLTIEQLEQLARSGEAYLAEGRAPSPALRSVFEKFKEWLVSIYQDIKGKLGVELSPEIRDLFDKVLSTRAERDLMAQSDVLGGGTSTSRLSAPRLPPPPGGGEPPRPADPILDRIGTPEPGSMRPTFNEAYTAIVDDLHPLRVFRDLLTKGEHIPADQDPYTLARISRGAYAKADQFIENSPFKFDTLKNTGKSLKAVLEPVQGDLDGFRKYAISARAMELNAREIETGIPIEDARATVKAGKSKYEKVFRELNEYQDNVLQYLRDSGVISTEAYQKIREANKDYVPFHRLMDSEGLGGAAGRGLTVRSPVRAIKGSGRKLIDPIETIIKNTYSYITIAERNRVLRSLVDLAEKSERGPELVEKVSTPLRPIKVTEQELSRFLKEQGIDATPEEMTIFRPKMMNLAPDEIAVFRDGKREVYRVGEETARAIKAIDRESAGMFVRLMAAPAKALRAGTTLVPDFFLRNIFRDQITATLLSKNQYNPLVDALRGMNSLFKKDDNYQNWLKSGGANSAMVAIDRNYIEQNVFKLAKDTGLISRVQNVVKSPLEALRVTSELLENSTRLGEYIKATKGAKSAADLFAGAYESREITLDFARMGAKTRAMNMITAFWNAQVQGLDRMGRAFKESPLGMTAKVTAGITMPSILLWWANKDDERYKELPRWQKDLFWIVITDKWEPADSEAQFNSQPEYLRRERDGVQEVNNGHIWRIPKPFEVGLLFGSLPERTLEAFVQNNPKAWRNFSDSMVRAFTPGYVPTVALPVVEHFANRSTFTGRNIVPAAMEGILPEYQYTEYTTETAKLLGKFVASLPVKDARFNSFASPAVLENYIRAWSGNLGRYALQMADVALQKTGVLPEPVRAASTLADMPVIKAFVVRYPSATAQSIQDFYDRYNKSQVVAKTIPFLAKGGNIEAAMKELGDPENAQYLTRLTGIKEALGNQMKFIRYVDKNPDIPPDEKRQLIDGIYYQMISGARMGNELLDQLDKARE